MCILHLYTRATSWLAVRGVQSGYLYLQGHQVVSCAGGESGKLVPTYNATSWLAVWGVRSGKLIPTGPPVVYVFVRYDGLTWFLVTQLFLHL